MLGEKPRRDQIVEYLRRYDTLLGSFLARLSPRDHVLILSDHGFERNPSSKGPPGIHHSAKTAVGVLILHGPRIAPGTRLRQGPTMLDVLPTVLELLGIPPARNMPGKVLTQAFRAPAGQLLARVPPYKRLPLETNSADEGIRADEETLERLRVLGYLN